MRDFDVLVGAIYDCAANPGLWPDTLAMICDELNSAYVMVGLADMSPIQYQLPPVFTFQHSPWDREKLSQLAALSHAVPGGEKVTNGGIDQAWTQMAQVSRSEFEMTHFNQSWSGPQGLMDALVVPYLSKQSVFGLLSCAKHRDQGDVYLEAECRLAERLSPHIRRSVMINDLADKGNMAMTLYRQVLDALSIAVFVVGLGGRMVFTNAAGDTLLSEGQILSLRAGVLQTAGPNGQSLAFETAISRAIKGDQALGIAGIGVPLYGPTGEKAAAYVLPVAGNDVRGAMGPGHCVVFVARRGEQLPMAVEVLRTVFDLTAAEARVATMIARGDGPAAIAEGLNISVNTVRTHLKHAFAKTSTADQTALGGLVNDMVLPLA